MTRTEEIIRDATQQALKMYGLAGAGLPTVLRQYGLAGELDQRFMPVSEERELLAGLGQFDFSSLISSVISAGSQIATAKLGQQAATAQAASAAKIAAAQAASAQAAAQAQQAAAQYGAVVAEKSSTMNYFLVGAGLLALVGVIYAVTRK